eukprot:8729208-Alexandrium_andersonii.AAC.1
MLEQLESAGTCSKRLKRCRPSVVDPPVPPDPNGRHTLVEDAFTEQLGAPRSAPSRAVGALSPVARH